MFPLFQKSLLSQLLLSHNLHFDTLHSQFFIWRLAASPHHRLHDCRRFRNLIPVKMKWNLVALKSKGPKKIKERRQNAKLLAYLSGVSFWTWRRWCRGWRLLSPIFSRTADPFSILCEKGSVVMIPYVS